MVPRGYVILEPSPGPSPRHPEQNLIPKDTNPLPGPEQSPSHVGPFKGLECPFPWDGFGWGLWWWWGVVLLVYYYCLAFLIGKLLEAEEMRHGM